MQLVSYWNDGFSVSLRFTFPEQSLVYTNKPQWSKMQCSLEMFLIVESNSQKTYQLNVIFFENILVEINFLMSRPCKAFIHVFYYIIQPLDPTKMAATGGHRYSSVQENNIIQNITHMQYVQQQWSNVFQRGKFKSRCNILKTLLVINY